MIAPDPARVDSRRRSVGISSCDMGELRPLQARENLGRNPWAVDV